jgi:hypothetical protein
MEIWKDIKGHQGYQVSHLGRVKNLNPSKEPRVKGESKLKATYQRGEVSVILNHYSKAKLSIPKLVQKVFQPQ